MNLRRKRATVKQLAERLQTLRLRKGWDMDHAARLADVSRTTLFHLERGEIPKPRASTLHKLAQAFEVPVDDLVASPDEPSAPTWPTAFVARPLPAAPRDSARAKPSGARKSRSRRAFDRKTNPVVAAVASAEPALFTGWGDDDWDELYSSFGTGGALT